MLLVLLRRPHFLELDLVRKPTRFLLTSTWGFGSRVLLSYTYYDVLAVFWSYPNFVVCIFVCCMWDGT
jgi:hypothetical protein